MRLFDTYCEMACAFSGELSQASSFLTDTPRALPLLIMFSITTYAGVASYLRLVSNFSGVTAVLVTTTRKIFTVVLSYMLFPKVLAWGHVGSGLMVLSGVFLNEVARRADKKSHKPPSDMTPKSAAKVLQVGRTEERLV